MPQMLVKASENGITQRNIFQGKEYVLCMFPDRMKKKIWMLAKGGWAIL